MGFTEPRFELTREELEPNKHLITVVGEIHVSTAPRFSEELAETLDTERPTIVLDLSEVDFIDSTGLSVLLNGLRRVTRQHGQMVLVATNPTVLRLFEITRLDSTFDIRATRADALAAVSAG